MCGRYGLKTTFSTLAKLLRAEPIEDHDWGPDFNIAPTDPAPVLLRDDAGATRLDVFRWGLLPFWADDPRIGARMINARSESVAKKAAFRESFETRRLLIPADGWYEWQAPPALATGADKKPQPWWFHAADDTPLVFAGIWSRWRDKSSGESRNTFSILTTDASPATAFVHDRMPVVLDADGRLAWLAPDTPKDALLELTRPFTGALVSHRVSKAVNSVRNDGPELIAPLAAEAQGKLL
jgi:putative SOS response-associated peptidase YedK